MSDTFRDFEKKAVRMLCAGALSDDLIAAIVSHSGTFEYEYTGAGYFLSIRELWLPEERATISEPNVVGVNGEVRAGFVAFVSAREFTLECHTWGGVNVPKDFRDREVHISIEPINVVELD